MSSIQPIRFDKYLLLDRIAIGGMAEVFRAKLTGEKGFEKPVVLKKMLPHLTDEEEMISHFIDEARLAAQLTHKNIIHIYDFGCVSGTFFIAMEYLFGKDLHMIIQQCRQVNLEMDLENILLAIANVCEGLGYAHHLKDLHGTPLNLIHRDISPHNIFITYEGQVKLIDFGIAKASLKSTKTQTGIIKGKAAYMSPEQAAGKPIDHRSDIFAVGIILYELVTGLKMFEGDTFQIISQVAQASYEPPEGVKPDLPKQLYSIIHKSLQKDPDKRYQSCEEMGKDIDDCICALNYRPNSKKMSGFIQSLFEGQYENEKQQMAEAMKQNVPIEPALTSGSTDSRSGTASLDAGSSDVPDRIPSETSSQPTHQPTEVIHMDLSDSGDVLKQKLDNLSKLAAAYFHKLKSMKIRTKKQVMVLSSIVSVVLIVFGMTIGSFHKSHDETVDLLIQKAENSLQEKRVVYPENDCAYYYYQEILKHDPDNKKAEEGLKKVLAVCTVMAEQEMKRLNLLPARNYIQIGLTIDPENERLLAMKAKTSSGAKLLINNVKRIFK